MFIADYHAKFYAHELSRVGGTGVDRLGRALFDACVERYPHQIGAALFALRSSLARGVLLADEVGLGKTVEAGWVLCQYWAERRRRLLVIRPASLRKQWGLELSEKFNLPSVILDAETFREMQKSAIATGTAGETKPVNVDLVETINCLLSFTVLAQGGSATSVKGGGVTWIEGTNPEGEKVLVLWRNTTAVDADALNAWCKKQKVSVLDGEFSLIYINGDHHLENLRWDDQTWKVRLIDEEFLQTGVGGVPVNPSAIQTP